MMYDRHAVEMAAKHSKAHPFMAGALTALYGAALVGLMPSKCEKCGTAYWIGGKLKDG